MDSYHTRHDLGIWYVTLPILLSKLIYIYTLGISFCNIPRVEILFEQVMYNTVATFFIQNVETTIET
mgnify:CR=1 FL=1